MNTNSDFLNSSLTYTDDGRLLDENKNPVMMDWEDGIMKDASSLICRDGGKILNIGFGLGIIDSYIQLHDIMEHWIIEAHPDVINKMKDSNWDKKNNVTCIFDDWKNVVKTLPKFDGIYFDTHCDDFNSFEKYIDLLLNPGGKCLIFSVERKNFNNLNPKFKIEEYETKINKIDLNQHSDGRMYWDPNNKIFIHQLIIKQ